MTQQTIDAFGAFYRTRPLPCPYLADRVESRIFTELPEGEGAVLYDSLARAGFRRSHAMAYRPACPGCDACIPVRVLAREFTAGNSLRRVVRHNGDLSECDRPAQATREQYQLFSAYMRSRHGEGEMAQMGFDDYRDMIEQSPIETAILEYRDPSRALVAVCLWDRLSDGLSAVYSFFDPEAGSRGLGNFMVLRMIERTRELDLPFLYLGYWIADSPKMSYKARFRPLEALGSDGWRLLEE